MTAAIFTRTESSPYTWIISATTPAEPEPVSGRMMAMGRTSAGKPTNASTGELSFNSLPDFENPDDAGTDNTYNLTITGPKDAADGTHMFKVVSYGEFKGQGMLAMNEFPLEIKMAAAATEEAKK